MIIRSREMEINEETIGKLVGEFNRDVLPRLCMLRDEYDGKSPITRRVRTAGLPNNRLAHPYQRYIVTMASGYLAGQPVQYTAMDGNDKAVDALRALYRVSDMDSIDSELARDASIYGKGVCITYIDSSNRVRCSTIDPRTAFVVYDDTVEHRPILGVHIYQTYAPDGRVNGKAADVYTERDKITYMRRGAAVGVDGSGGFTQERVEEHLFDGVPIIEVWNDADETGDFERVLSLIHAYDQQESDRVNDKQQFTDAILLLTGCVLEKNDDDDDEDQRTPAQKLLEEKTLSLPDTDAKAEWLVKQSDESGNEILRLALKSDIHKLSMVPDLSDENFAANASGVAMKYKLLGFEQLTKNKERYFREGLMSRMRIYAGILKTRDNITLDPEQVQITFTRSLPANETEIASMVSMLEGIVPKRTLLAQVPFVEDVDAAMDEMTAEKAEAARVQREAFGADYYDANQRAQFDTDGDDNA